MAEDDDGTGGKSKEWTPEDMLDWYSERREYLGRALKKSDFKDSSAPSFRRIKREFITVPDFITSGEQEYVLRQESTKIIEMTQVQEEGSDISTELGFEGGDLPSWDDDEDTTAMDDAFDQLEKGEAGEERQKTTLPPPMPKKGKKQDTKPGAFIPPQLIESPELRKIVEEEIAKGDRPVVEGAPEHQELDDTSVFEQIKEHRPPAIHRVGDGRGPEIKTTLTDLKPRISEQEEDMEEQPQQTLQDMLLLAKPTGVEVEDVEEPSDGFRGSFPEIEKGGVIEGFDEDAPTEVHKRSESLTEAIAKAINRGIGEAEKQKTPDLTEDVTEEAAQETIQEAASSKPKEAGAYSVHFSKREDVSEEDVSEIDRADPDYGQQVLAPFERDELDEEEAQAVVEEKPLPPPAEKIPAPVPVVEKVMEETLVPLINVGDLYEKKEKQAAKKVPAPEPKAAKKVAEKTPIRPAPAGITYASKQQYDRILGAGKPAEKDKAGQKGLMYLLTGAWLKKSPGEKLVEQRRKAEEYKRIGVSMPVKIGLGVGAGLALLTVAFSFYSLVGQRQPETTQTTKKAAFSTIDDSRHTIEERVEKALASAGIEEGVDEGAGEGAEALEKPGVTDISEPIVIAAAEEEEQEPDMVLSPPEPDFGCGMKVGMHYDSTEYLNQDAPDDLEKYILSQYKSGKKVFYLYGFASIENRGDMTNDDAKHNTMLGFDRASVVRAALLKAKAKHNLHDLVIKEINSWSEVEIWGKGAAYLNVNRGVYVSDMPLDRNVESNDELMDFLGGAKNGDIHGCEQPEVQDASERADNASGKSSIGKIAGADNIDDDGDAAAMDNDGAPRFTGIQKTIIDQLYRQYAFGRSLTAEELANRAANYGVKGLTVDAAREIYLDIAMQRDEPDDVPVSGQEKGGVTKQDYRTFDMQFGTNPEIPVYAGLTPDDITNTEKGRIMHLYSRFFGRQGTEGFDESFAKAAAAYGFENLTWQLTEQICNILENEKDEVVTKAEVVDLENPKRDDIISRLTFYDNNDKNNKIDFSAHSVVREALHVDEAPKSAYTAEQARHVYEFTEKGYDFEDIKRMAMLRGISLTIDNFEELYKTGKQDKCADARQGSELDEALAEINSYAPQKPKPRELTPAEKKEGVEAVFDWYFPEVQEAIKEHLDKREMAGKYPKKMSEQASKQKKGVEARFDSLFPEVKRSIDDYNSYPEVEVEHEYPEVEIAEEYPDVEVVKAA